MLLEYDCAIVYYIKDIYIEVFFAVFKCFIKSMIVALLLLYSKSNFMTCV